MGPLSISNERCRRCYRCVRVCPTNALKIDQGTVKRIESRCIFCGLCYKICPHEAVVAHTGADKVMAMLEAGENVVACLDSTFPAVLDRGTPGQLVSGLKRLGFSEVWESAFGGELIVEAYRSWLDTHDHVPSISSFCPAVVLYLQKYVPDLVDRLVPLVSPMIATARAIHRIKDHPVHIVYIGSCIARIQERRDRHVKSEVDYVLTYNDIMRMFRERSIDRLEMAPAPFDNPPSHQASLLSIAGGFSQLIGFEQDLMNLDTVVASDPERTKRTLFQLSEGTIKPKFLDILFCHGCIDGPIVDRRISGPSRTAIVVDYIRYRQVETGEKANKELCFENLNLERAFTAKGIQWAEPSETEIQEVLGQMNKQPPDRNLDCGACGYNTCREKAAAIVQGLAEMEMCPHYLLERCRSFYARLDKSHKMLKASHEQLESAQRQLVQTEKMASLGQLAAGVAHELNNPLGTITMFGRLMQKSLAGDEKMKKDMDLIVAEADRAAKIVKDLLSFSRETKVKPGLVNINVVIEEAVTLITKQAILGRIRIEKQLNPSLPTTFADSDLIKQVVLNMVLNGIQAMENGGVLSISTAAEKRTISILIRDTGAGIPPEHLSRLFDPFFTTKKKGTGLGLALSYGIISRHNGSISVESEVGKGTAFTIFLPVLDQSEWLKQTDESNALDKTHGGMTRGPQSQNLIG